VIVKRCPWHDIMVKSGREQVSQRVSDLICRVENSVWSSEFSGAGEKGEASGESWEIGFEREERICQGEGRCVLRFYEREETSGKAASYEATKPKLQKS
jgi:hypothetical protein